MNHSSKIKIKLKKKNNPRSNFDYELTLAKPSAVPVWVPKKMVTFFFPSSTSSGSTLGLGTTSLGGSESLFLAPDRRQRRRTTQPMSTAIEVVNNINKSLFSKSIANTSWGGACEELFELSILTRLKISVINSNAESFSGEESMSDFENWVDLDCLFKSDELGRRIWWGLVMITGWFCGKWGVIGNCNVCELWEFISTQKEERWERE